MRDDGGVRKVRNVGSVLIDRPAGAFAPQYRAVTVAIVALTLLVAYEYLAVATAMPMVATVLNGERLYALAFSGSLAAGVVGMVAGGRWNDVTGPQRPIWVGVVSFMAGLAVSGAAPNMEVFIAGRLLQGFGGGLFSVSLYVLVGRVYPGPLHPKVFSLLAAAWVVPSMVGPTITGLLVDGPGWRWVFLGVPAATAPAAVLLWRGMRDGRASGGEAGHDAPAGSGTAMPEDEAGPGGGPEAAPGGAAPGGRAAPGGTEGVPEGSLGRRLRRAGAAAVGAALLQYGAGLLQEDGGRQGAAGALLFAAGLVVLAVALPPLLPAGTLRAARGLPTVVALRGLAAGAFFAAEVLVPLLLARERGLPLWQAGLALTGSAVAWSLGSWVQGRRPRDRRLILRLGTALIALGSALVPLTLSPAVPVLVCFGAWAVSGFGMGMVYPTLSVLVLELSPPHRQGVNSSALQIGESVFSVVAVAVTGALLAALGRTVTAYVVCFGVVVLIALSATAIAGRFEQAR
jgi:Arabinose efflux permease